MAQGDFLPKKYIINNTEDANNLRINVNILSINLLISNEVTFLLVNAVRVGTFRNSK